MIIAFTGFKQVGKSTACAHLAEKHGFVRHNFKDALVREMKENLPTVLKLLSSQYACSVEELFDHKPPLMRALMQNYGTDVRRKDDDYYWIDKWHDGVCEDEADYVVDDVRFLNEADAISQYDGIIIRLTRPDIQTGGTHQSELEHLDIPFDYEISCEQGDHESLYKSLDQILTELK